MESTHIILPSNVGYSVHQKFADGFFTSLVVGTKLRAFHDISVVILYFLVDLILDLFKRILFLSN